MDELNKRKKYSSVDEFFEDLKKLIDNWCDRRCLTQLSVILPSYVSFAGLTDSWGELLTSLNTLRIHQRDLPSIEQDIIEDLRQAALNVIHTREL